MIRRKKHLRNFRATYNMCGGNSHLYSCIESQWMGWEIGAEALYCYQEKKHVGIRHRISAMRMMGRARRVGTRGSLLWHPDEVKSGRVCIAAYRRVEMMTCGFTRKTCVGRACKESRFEARRSGWSVAQKFPMLANTTMRHVHVVKKGQDRDTSTG